MSSNDAFFFVGSSLCNVQGKNKETDDNWCWNRKERSKSDREEEITETVIVLTCLNYKIQSAH